MGRSADLTIPLSTAAMRLRVPYRQAYDLALVGRLGDVQRRGSRLYVAADAVQAAVDRQAGNDAPPQEAA